MKNLFGYIVVAALLTGCGPSHDNGLVPIASADGPLRHHKNFRFTGKKQLFKVPAGVTTLQVDVHGGNGAGKVRACGGRVIATIQVKPNERLAVYVGSNGDGEVGGYNGGGSGKTYSSFASYGGGGASDIREGGGKLQNRIVVAGGGGGQGGFDNAIKGQHYGEGGNGGGSTGGSGQDGFQNISPKGNDCKGGGTVGSGETRYDTSSYGYYGRGGSGGTQASGGSGGQGGEGHSGSGQPGGDGSLGQGGSGGYATTYGDGGGGGGGYYAGGGGGGGGVGYGGYSGGGGGGGGGSSYIEPSASSFQNWQGWKLPYGIVVVSW